jgi:flavin reductase (DIM6/NTAB) family NADH-FMN oxidoreductase RutF
MGEKKIESKALWDISYGLYIVTSIEGEKYDGLIVNTVMQVTSAPAKIAICLNKESLTHNYILSSNVFGVSVLEQETPMPYIGIFGFRTGKNFQKFSQPDVHFKVGSVTGVPLVTDYTLSLMEAKLVNSVDVGTHTIFIGEIVNCEVLKDGTVLTYDYYQKVKKGKAPKNAPTYKGV